MIKLKFQGSPVVSATDLARLMDDKDLPLSIAAPELAGTGTIPAGPANITFSGKGSLAVEAFNSPDDIDRDGIIGKEPKSSTVAPLPQLFPQPGQTWMKYRLALETGASAKMTIPSGSISFGADREVVFIDYHPHPPGRIVKDALRADIEALRIAADPGDLISLGPGDALAFLSHGSLSAGLALSWSDAFSAGLSELSQTLGLNKPLVFRTGLDASIDFSVKWSDDFKVVFTREEHGGIRVAVFKTQTDQGKGTGAFGITVGFDAESILRDTLDAFTRGMFSCAVEDIDNILNTASLNNLPEPQQALFRLTAEVLGLGGALQSVQDLKKSWDELKNNLSKWVKKTLNLRATLSFQYTYLRMDKESLLLQAVMDETLLKKIHYPLMQGELDAVTNPANRAALEVYLLEKSRARSHAWGFTLGIGPWSVCGRDTKKFTETITEDRLTGRRKIAIHGLRSYSQAWFGDKATWVADLDASMADFSTSGVPTADEFGLRLHLSWQWNEAHLKAKEFALYLDSAVIWGLLTEMDAAEWRNQLDHRIGKNQSAKIRLGLTFTESAFQELLEKIPVDFSSLRDRAFARALPWVEQYQARKSSKMREEVYAGFWSNYFQQAALTGIGQIETLTGTYLTQLAVQSRDSLVQTAAGQVLSHEKRSIASWSLPALIYNNGKTLNDGDFSGINVHWTHFIEGLTLLRDARRKKQSWEEIPRAMGHLQEFFGQALYMRAAGAWLMMLSAQSDPIIPVSRSFTLTFPETKECYDLVAPMPV